MKFTYDGNLYEIGFQHSVENGWHDPFYKRDITMALLLLVHKDGESELVDRSRICRWGPDKPCKETARKRSLEKLLDAKSYSKPFRTAAWKAYLGRKEKGSSATSGNH